MSLPLTPGATRRTFTLLALGFAAFTVYGSLVPFHFRYRTLEDAWGAFGWVLGNSRRAYSNSDWLANCLLGFPLGYCLMGAWQVDRFPPGRRTLAQGVAAVLLGAALAAAVEFAQLFFPPRNCSASDILAQTLGCALGVAVWAAAGRRLTDRLRDLANHPAVDGAAGVYLGAALFAVLAVELLPLDLEPSPGTLARRLKHGLANGAVTLVPFGDPAGADPAWVKLLRLFALFAPVGLVAARWKPPLRRGGVRRAWVYAGGLLFALACEAGQLSVSRHPSSTDALVGGLAIAVAYEAERAGGSRPALAAYGAMLVALAWTPAESAEPLSQRSQWVWLPLADTFHKRDLDALEILAAQVALWFLPGWALARRRRPAWAAALAASAFALALELGQLAVPGRTASTTGVLVAALGAALGCKLGRRLGAWPAAAVAAPARRELAGAV